MTMVLRKVDARAWFALFMVGVGLMWNWDSLAREVSDDGVVESCSYYDVLDMIVGPFAIVLAVAAILTTDIGRNRLSTAAVGTAGIVGGVLVSMHGLGMLGGRCEEGSGSEGTGTVVFLVLVGLSLIAPFLDKTKPIPPPSLLVEGSNAPVYEGGVQRCQACQFSSNPIDATECRMCGSTDLVAVPGPVTSPSGPEQP
jgi:hypothetical protein